MPFSSLSIVTVLSLTKESVFRSLTCIFYKYWNRVFLGGKIRDLGAPMWMVEETSEKHRKSENCRRLEKMTWWKGQPWALLCKLSCNGKKQGPWRLHLACQCWPEGGLILGLRGCHIGAGRGRHSSPQGHNTRFHHQTSSAMWFLGSAPKRLTSEHGSPAFLEISGWAICLLIIFFLLKSAKVSFCHLYLRTWTDLSTLEGKPEFESRQLDQRVCILKPYRHHL